MLRSSTAVPASLGLLGNRSARGTTKFPLAGLLLKAGILLLVLNEVRGCIMAAPLLYGIYAAGGTWTAMWIGFCSLTGIATSVIAPLFIARKLKLYSTSAQ